MPTKDHIPIKAAFQRHLTPPRIFILSFAFVILIGGVLLWFPFSCSQSPLRFIDALFTAAAAVCVTGLTVIDLGKDLSFTGQVITIFLFQIGGLGIITFSAFLFGLMGKGMSFKGREIVQSTFLHTPRRDFFIILKSVLMSTLIIESIGVLLLFSRFSFDFSPGEAFFHAVYNAISAFNNCGFSLFSDKLVRYQGDLVINITIMGLIILGGIGFVVHHEVFYRLKGPENRLSLHTKLVLLTTVILIFAGAMLFYFFERSHSLREVPFHTRILISFFQSVASRTAGFNTVDIGQLTNATLLVMIVLMFIGASPGSTGGGIKTTSASLLFLMIWNRWRGSEEVNIFNRTVPKEIMSRTISIIFAAALFVFLITSVLLIADERIFPPMESHAHFLEYLFEAVSAFGTVGLSMGITSQLNDLQKLALMLMMFAGRVGLLTLAFSLSMSSARKGIVYAEETIMVG
jgi:trk system potassium uptake protein